MFFVFVGSPISTLLSVLEKQKLGLFFNIVLFTVRITSLIIGGLLSDIILALMLFSISGVIIWAWFCWYLTSCSGVATKNIFKIIIKHLTIAIFCIMPVILSKYLLPLDIIGLFSITILSTLVFVIYIIMQDNRLKKIISFVMGKRIS